MTANEFRLNVNGSTRNVTCEPDTPLLEVLRGSYGLAGPKYGCGIGVCGACFVLVDGRACASCDLPVSAVTGPVVSLEGLPVGGRLHPVQQAFIDEQAAQCGYCTSGMVVSAVGLLREHPAPTDQQVREALDKNLCRCGAYGRIVRAVLRAVDGAPGPQAATRRAEPNALASGGRARPTHVLEPTVLGPGAGSPVALGAPEVAPGSSPLPPDLAANPLLARWLDFSRDGEVTVRTGKVEYGQGIWTALAQIAAEELQVALARVRMGPVSTGTSPDEGVTAGSLSVQDSGAALRQACAQARGLLLCVAATRLGTSPSALTVCDGGIRTGERETGLTYWTVAQPGMLERSAGVPAPPRPPSEWSVAGSSAGRLDIPDKVAGRPRFLHDLVLPGMAHGRVVRPPGRAWGLSELADLDLGADVVLVRDGTFVGVVAPTDGEARQAAGRVAEGARWRETASLPDADDLRRFLLSAASEAETVIDEPEGPTAVAARTLTAEFTRPFLAHASLGPSCAIARWDGGSVTVWSHSQGIFLLRAAIAAGLGLEDGRVTVYYVEGAGVYGQNGADDVAMDAVLLARAVPGRAVRVQWTREDEMCWAPLGPAMLVRVSASLDDDGRVGGWHQDVWSNGFMGRPTMGGQPRLLALTHLAGGAPMPPAPDGQPAGWMGASRNAIPGYDIAGVHVTRHHLLDMPIRTSSLRSLGAHLNVFAIESFMDELASAAATDPVEFRLGHLVDPRARRVLTDAASMAGWGTRAQRGGVGFGVGVARYSGIAGYCAAVAEVEAETEVRVRRLWLAVDVGRAINPDGVANQIEGGAVQSASWTIREQVRFDRHRITSASWDTYPVLRSAEAPEVTVQIVDAPAEPELGAGEISLGPVAGAIGNAVADAVGVRVRDLPLTRERIVRAIEAG